MSNMNPQQELNEYFKAYVSTWHPDWSGGLFIPEASSEGSDSAILHLENPRGEESPRLEIRTEDQRLTVQFASHHAHFQSEDPEKLFVAAFDLVSGVINERIVSLFLFYGASPYVSDFCHVEDLPAVEAASRPRRKAGWLSRFLGRGNKPDSGTTTWRSYGPVHYVLGPPPAGRCTLEIHSWLGTHDGRTLLD